MVLFHALWKYKSNIDNFISDIFTSITFIYIGIKICMHDLTFYSKKYKCPLMSLFYLEIIDPTSIFLFIKKWMLHSSLAYMQLKETSPTDVVCYYVNLILL